MIYLYRGPLPHWVDRLITGLCSTAACFGIAWLGMSYLPSTSWLLPICNAVPWWAPVGGALGVLIDPEVLSLTRPIVDHREVKLDLKDETEA
jgi:hypothetical protein